MRLGSQPTKAGVVISLNTDRRACLGCISHLSRLSPAVARMVGFQESLAASIGLLASLDCLAHSASPRQPQESRQHP